MIPWIRLDAVETPDGPELRLMRRGSEFSIMLGANELMNSRVSGSEAALAALACARLADPGTVSVLIGGLGMGFTLRAALAALGKRARVCVAELFPCVIAWARGPMAEVFGDCLTDARVALHTGDVGSLIRDSRGGYDAILLDVDNGPDGLSRRENDSLYSAPGLREAYAALRLGGVLAVWSAVPDPAFTRRLQQAGFAVEAVPVRARGKRGARHVIWLAVRP